tara:strand:- start:1064 stop:1531 length:468 start_codon:yes stop_codon:yes gene_type:complete
MTFKTELYKKIAHVVLALLFIGIICSCFTFQRRVVQNLSFRENTNLNSNREGFGNKDKDNKDADLIKLIENKLKGLQEELGGKSGIKEVKEVLTNTKKIVNLEGAKCIINMIEDNKGSRSIDIEKLLSDDNEDNNVKCEKYSTLSSAITDILENL